MSNPNRLGAAWEQLMQNTLLPLIGHCECPECQSKIAFAKKLFYTGTTASTAAAGYFLSEEEATVDEIEQRIIDLCEELEVYTAYVEHEGKPLDS